MQLPSSSSLCLKIGPSKKKNVVSSNFVSLFHCQYWKILPIYYSTQHFEFSILFLKWWLSLGLWVKLKGQIWFAFSCNHYLVDIVQLCMNLSFCFAYLIFRLVDLVDYWDSNAYLLSNYCSWLIFLFKFVFLHNKSITTTN